MSRKHERRLERNDESRERAEHHREPWSADEIEQLVGFWDGTDETLVEIADLLGRTIEACRERYYLTVRGEGKNRVHHKVTVISRGWMVGYCFKCGHFGDVFSDGAKAECEDCRG